MTFAPASIVDARTFLLAEFDMHPGTVAVDLDPDEAGIVGDPAHHGGYHCGRDRTVSGDYSVVESPRDSRGLTLAASALDVGEFNRSGLSLRTLSLWLVGQCRAGTPDTQDIREVIYTPDGRTVRRWDRLGRRTSGDSGHLTHTHISYFRDSEGRSKRPLFERFVAAVEGGDMAGEIADKALAALDGGNALGDVYLRLLTGRDNHGAPSGDGAADANLTEIVARLRRLEAAVAAVGPPPVKVDAAELAAALLAQPGFAAALAEAAFTGAQRAERE